MKYTKPHLLEYIKELLAPALKKSPKTREVINNLLEEKITDGNLMPLKRYNEEVRPDVKQHTLYLWAQEGKLKTTMLAGKTYVINNESNKVIPARKYGDKRSELKKI